ncbi:hypothetical protein [Paradevosia shaoguanensis]|uniref:sunset domain-containing protein n=1 Tax=Paradevosia shaoguanensis TaxID=1335043 RepID=UPI00193327EB|nr:hypothetical protein [Paradevosia shaoguanensis]
MNNLLRVAAVAAIAIGSVDLAAARECNIKGNVSTKGERIYHMPGQKYYDDTVIQSSHGERWFCSEAEARAAGWRRSKV